MAVNYLWSRVSMLVLVLLLASLADAVPSFTGPSSRTVYINENPASGAYVLTAHASDPDGGTFTFGLSSSTTPFSIDANTGIVTVSDPSRVDREMNTNGITFTVNLLSATSDVLATLQVTVRLNDVNDNSPSWDNPPTTPVSLSDATPIGTVIYTLVVSDADLGANADVRFRLLTPTDGTFSVNAITGVLSLARSLDFDTTSSYSVHIIAQDQGSVPLSTNIMFTISITSAAVTIPPPSFVQTHYSVSVDEGDYLTTSANLVTVTARDVTNPTAMIRYRQITRGDTSDSLFMVSSSGVVSAVGVLDRETVDFYMINIAAFVADGSGNPASRSATATVAITVEDINDNSPVLENPHPNPIELLETQPVGVVIYSPIVSDADSGTNGDISFRLSSPTNGPFVVNQFTGVVTLSSVLDYDVDRSYTLNIVAQDEGDTPRSTTIVLTVNVLDVLDPPPQFTQSTYSVEVAEDTYMMSTLIDVVAIDALHPGALINYQQVMRGDITDDLFDVNNASQINPGRMTVTGTLDRELESTYTINIEAWRTNAAGEIRSAVSLVSVVITVTDVNDNTPMIVNAPPSTITLQESDPIGTIVYSLVVRDPDEGSNGEVTFTLNSPNDGTFSVSNLGVLTLRRALDVDVASSYTVLITVSDRGSPANQFTDSRTVTVMPTAVVIPAPVFGQLVYYVSQPEGDYSTEQAGTHLTTVSATTVQPYSVTYTQQARMDSTDTLFAVNSATGGVTVEGMLDREMSPTHVITVQASVVDAMGNTVNAQASTATIVITVTDVNDNPPTFFTDNFVGSVSELAQTGNIAVAGVRAFDLDAGDNSVFSFGFADTASTVPFSIDANTGVITVSGSLDYETTQQYSFMIKAQETRTTARLQTQAQVTINIINENDNLPTFSSTSYTFDVAENLAPQALTSTNPAGLTMIQAMDSDLGTYGQVTYDLLGLGAGSLFSVGSSNGQISTVTTLDREQRSEYHLILVAEDGTMAGSTPHRVTTSIIIRVTDVNDNTPIVRPAAHTAFLTEGLSYNNFLFVHATDGDSTGPNSQIQYGITFRDGTSSSPMFTIDATTGGVSASGLDYEQATSHSLTIIASDSGSPARTGTANLEVTVTPVNDLAPVFSSPTYTATVPESQTVGSSIGVTLSATDPEPGHTVTYFSVSSDAHSAFFQIDQSSGSITLAHSLDADPPTSHSSFSFRVIAVDNAAPARTGTATVSITVMNVNDNSPVITNPPDNDPGALAYTIAEGAGTPIPRPLLTVAASDVDGDTITYAINPPSAFFTIDSSTGDVVQTAMLNYATSTQHSLTITACDPTPNCDSATLTISVSDYNNNRPAFSSLTFTTSVSECAIRDNLLLTTVTATDLVDTGSFATIEYSAVAGDVARFDLNSVTGDIRVAPGLNWDYETPPNMFVLEVRATDNPMGTPRLTSANDAVLTVTVTDCNDHPPIFSRASYAFTIPERTAGPAANEVVFSGISTVDNDASAANRVVMYSVVGGVSATNNWLDVSSTSGEINLRSGAVLDREDPAVLINSLGQGVLTFTVQAANNAPTGNLSSTATVTVTITDINDHSPVFEQSDPVRLTVVEHSQPPGSFLTDISATDADFGTNAHIRYSILAGNTNNEFAINADTGVMTVVGDLDQEDISMYTLTVQAENNMATGASPSTIRVIVMIEESNDHNPIFTMPQYFAQIREYDSITDTNGAAEGSAVGVVSATDQDGLSSPAGQVEYEIVSGHLLGDEEIFNISDPDTGVIIVLRPDLIDYETNSQFDLVVIAHDLVLPENQRRQGTAHFIINVTDVNDNRPVFVDLEYYAVVVEEQPVGTSATLNSTIMAQDVDRNGQDPLIYSLVSGTPFSLSSDGRTLTTTAVLDRETTDSYIAMINVQDSGGYSTLAQLYTEVADVNDNRPCFTQSSTQLATRIPENVPVFPDPMSMVVQTVTATDVDLDTTIMYYIGGGARGDFDVDSLTGEVRVIDALDLEDIDQYILNITATDGLLTCSVAFTITITEVNDNNPVFDEPVFAATLLENVPIGTTVPGLQLTATDLDRGSEVTFMIVPGTSNSFVITEAGFVVTNATLDRETRSMHTFRARATDGFFFTLEDSFVEITLSDVNDERPVFEEQLYEVDVQELTPARAIILIVNAEDADEGTNAEIRYSISESNPPSSSGLFSIDPINGAIAPTAQIDISMGDPTRINLTVTATDQGPSALNGTTTVAFSLVDRNLNAPQFSPPHYNFSATENTLGAIVGRVLAQEPNDDDIGTVIIYGIVVDSSDGASLFSINSASGDISTAATLDRETRDVYTITVMARDSDDPPRTGYASVTVHVLDDNDHTPFFDPAAYPIAISESTSVGSTIVRVFASDNDIGTNAMLSYNITRGNNSAFEIDSSGVITSLMPLDRESISTYSLIVTATDGAAQPRSATANVTISINDENDNSPRFTSGAVLSTSPQSVPEDAEPLTLITTVQAEDPDFQLNGIVIYTFDNLTQTKGPFQIDRESGEIRVRSGMEGRLDRETVSTYDLTVVASDQRGFGPQVRSTVGTFRIDLEDVNDNIPTFNMPLYEFNLREDFYREDPDADSPQPMFGKVTGVDRDIGENAINYYHALGDSSTNTSCVNQFCVGLETGNLILVGSLDREAQSTYIFTVAVSNNRILEFNETTGAPEGASTASVSVSVTDYNDETPEFVPSSLSSSVAEEAPFGTTVTTLRATDADIGNNSIVYFRILSNNVPYVVDRDTGVVTTAGVFEGLSGTIHTVEVEAFDNFGIPPTNRRSSEMTVRIYKLSDQVILTFRMDKDLVERKIDTLQSALEDLIGGEVVITEVRVEQTDDGSVDTTGTDVLFFAVQSVTSEVIPPSTLIRLIDARYSIVEDVFTQCNIETIEVFRPPLSKRTVIPYWVWIILAVMILIIACLCCCFLIGCVIERRRNRRWRRKSQTMHKSATSDLEQFSMYNYQSQANPVYAAAADWDLETSEVTSVSTIDQPNPLYASQEIEVEMPPEESYFDVESSSRLSSESQEFKMEYEEDAASLEGPGSAESLDNLIKSTGKRKRDRYNRYSDYGTDEDMLARAIQDTDEDDDGESKTSYI